MFNIKRMLINQVKEINELDTKDENSKKIKILVNKDVYDLAKKMAQELNTDVEGVFALAAQRLIVQAQQRVD